MIIMITMYTFNCFSIFGYQDPDKKKSMLRNQNFFMFLIHMTAFLVMYLETEDIKILMFYVMQVVLFGTTILFYTLIYPKVSRLIVNNMCMLLSIGFIMLTRLDYKSAVKQFMIAAVAIAISLVVPVIIRKFKLLSEWRNFYAVVGIVSLAAVIVVGRVSYGAMLGFEIAGINIQPSELVKIVFVFFVASSFKMSLEFKDIVITTAIAAFHVLILVVSKDLGAALIIFVVYLVMLYVATHQPLYILAGLGAGSIASVVAYKIFNHIRVRVLAWKDPFAAYDQGGYQVAQSLFAIGTGSWFGMGLFQGKPDTIPVAESDFIFSAISEELGLIFALCMILICVSCYVMFLNIAMQ
ncbi:MAG: FtsW/RodA/SpoVE family cell cycle protein, partial [Dorea sp.]